MKANFRYHLEFQIRSINGKFAYVHRILGKNITNDFVNKKKFGNVCMQEIKTLYVRKISHVYHWLFDHKTAH